MKAFLRLLALSAAAGAFVAPTGATQAQLLITGNDEKVSFDETGKTVTHPPGKDTVSVVDIREPTSKRRHSGWGETRRRYAYEGDQLRVAWTSGLNAGQHAMTITKGGQS